jgi:hypothetical protein
MTRAKLMRHGKSSQGLLKHKTAMYEANARLAQRNDDIAAVYLRQPPRTQCKNCASSLGNTTTFTSHGIGYIECPTCSHLNGAHEETAAFCDFLYTRDDGKAYAQAYSAEDAAQYQSRVQDIYLPKAAFLAEALVGESVDFRTCAVADIGAGSGYFVAALQQQGFNPVTGFEVSADQVALGNRMLPGQPLQQYPADATDATLAGLTARVVSLIGVLEHVLSPRAALAAIAGNRNVEFLYLSLSLPLYSASVAIEAAFPQVFNRHLGGAHTHLYSERSIRHFSSEFGFEPVAEWWFGLDLTDLFRSLYVTLAQNPETAALSERIAAGFGQYVDDLQQSLDAAKGSSEVHLLLRKTAL